MRMIICLSILFFSSLSYAQPLKMGFPTIKMLCSSGSKQLVPIFTDSIPTLTTRPNSLKLYFHCGTKELFLSHQSVSNESDPDNVTIVKSIAYGRKYIQLQAYNSHKIILSFKKIPMPLVHPIYSGMDFYLNVKYLISFVVDNNQPVINSDGTFKTQIQRSVKISGDAVRFALDLKLLEPSHIKFTQVFSVYKPDSSGFGSQAALLSEPIAELSRDWGTVRNVYELLSSRNRWTESRLDVSEFNAEPSVWASCRDLLD